METNRVVAKFKDGRLLKGKTADFFPTKKNFHIELLTGEIVLVDVTQLKAIFFVKDFFGNKEYNETYNDQVPGGGKKIKVHFFDGETIIGYTLAYSPDRIGFFMIPADKGSNNSRIFVVNSSIESFEFIS